MGTVKSETVLMTPERALHLLSKNISNRKVSSLLVDRYARDMTLGDWQQNGSSIVVNGDGTLLDGQHRLLACVKSGSSFTTVLTSGVPAEAMVTLDTGRPRKLSDVLTMRGERSAKTLAAVLRLAYLWGQSGDGQPPSGPFTSPSYSEQLAFLDRWPESRDATSCADHKKPRGLTGACVGAFALNLIVTNDDRDYVDRFLLGVMTGDVNQSEPAFSLWRTFNNWASQPSTRRDPVVYLALLIKCWNASVTGQGAKQWIWRRAGSAAESFPRLIDMDGQPVSICK